MPSRIQARRAAGSVCKKRGRWYAILTVGRENGRQIRHWSNAFETKRAAERALAQLLIDERSKKETRATVYTVVCEYIKHDKTSKGERSPTTTQGYEYLFRKLAPLHDRPVERLDAAAIEALYESLRDSGLSETTVHHVHNLLFAACRWAKRRSIAVISRNPFEIYDDIQRPRRRQTPARAFTREQARKALQYLSHTKHANALIFSLATACRRGEACGLKWDCVDVERRVITIQESRFQVKGRQGQKRTKSEQVREVPLNKTALRALQRERNRQRERLRRAGDAWTASGHVFTDELGRPLSPMALTNAFGRCAKRAGLPTTRMHDLRHTAATFILSAGGNPVAASKILGHSDKATTLRMYGHVIDADAVDAVKSIDDALRDDKRKQGRCRKAGRQRYA